MDVFFHRHDNVPLRILICRILTFSSYVLNFFAIYVLQKANWYIECDWRYRPNHQRERKVVHRM
jgi:hypothetical protein